MCVIFNKRGGSADVISDADFSNMWHSNPHGAGFAWRVKIGEGPWSVSKGYMTLSDAKAFWNTIKASDEIIGHFRYATHGAVNIKNCHPFSTGKTLEDCLTLGQGGSGIIGQVLFHNGVISEFGSKEVSDSADFCLRAISPLGDFARKFVLENTSGKFAYIDEDGEVHLFGTYSKHNQFVEVSNLNWEERSFWLEGNRHHRHGGGGSNFLTTNFKKKNRQSLVKDWSNDNFLHTGVYSESQKDDNDNELTLGIYDDDDDDGGLEYERILPGPVADFYKKNAQAEEILYLDEYDRLCFEYESVTLLAESAEINGEEIDMKVHIEKLAEIEYELSDLQEIIGYDPSQRALDEKDAADKLLETELLEEQEEQEE